MARKLPQVKLDLLKKLVSELEVVLATNQDLPTEKEEDVINFITEISKASGLAAGAAQEASLLVKDIYKLIRLVQQPSMSLGGSEEELLMDLLGGALPHSDGKNRN